MTQNDEITNILSSFAESARNYCNVTQDHDTQVRMYERAFIASMVMDALGSVCPDGAKANLASMTKDMDKSVEQACRGERPDHERVRDRIRDMLVDDNS